mmetsp:Transcript_8798/g.22520  ORF Transcript_8798/g.22520 Transcript_8798/m.22520 type:complete len:455 (+) Transcript_8798:3-1367(+)
MMQRHMQIDGEVKASREALTQRCGALERRVLQQISAPELEEAVRWQLQQEGLLRPQLAEAAAAVSAAAAAAEAPTLPRQERRQSPRQPLEERTGLEQKLRSLQAQVAKQAQDQGQTTLCLKEIAQLVAARISVADSKCERMEAQCTDAGRRLHRKVTEDSSRVASNLLEMQRGVARLVDGAESLLRQEPGSAVPSAVAGQRRTTGVQTATWAEVGRPAAASELSSSKSSARPPSPPRAAETRSGDAEDADGAALGEAGVEASPRELQVPRSPDRLNFECLKLEGICSETASLSPCSSSVASFAARSHSVGGSSESCCIEGCMPLLGMPSRSAFSRDRSRSYSSLSVPPLRLAPPSPMSRASRFEAERAERAERARNKVSKEKESFVISGDCADLDRWNPCPAGRRPRVLQEAPKGRPGLEEAAREVVPEAERRPCVLQDAAARGGAVYYAPGRR